MKIKEYEENKSVKIIKWISYSLFVLCFILVLFNCFYTINEGERGILLTFGKASNDIKMQGLHIKVPYIQTVVKMEIRTQKYEALASSASKDLQIVSANIATNFKIDESKLIYIYSTLGLNYADRIIKPIEQEVVKAVTAKYTAEELITKREEARMEIKHLLESKLLERNIIVEEVSITNFDFSKSFNDAIEAKVTAEQIALKAQRDLERIKIEKEQAITQAEAISQSTKLKADAEAYSLRIIREELEKSDNLIEYKYIEKWNGVMPKVTSSTGNLLQIPIED